LIKLDAKRVNGLNGDYSPHLGSHTAVDEQFDGGVVFYFSPYGDPGIHTVHRDDRDAFERLVNMLNRAGVDLHAVEVEHHVPQSFGFASQLILIGQPMKVVQELLGHSDIRMTDIYSHLTPNANQDAIESLLEVPNEPKSGRNMGTVIDFSEFSNAQ
jgi:integrase